MTREFAAASSDAQEPHHDHGSDPAPAVLTDEQVKARSKRNVAIALSLVGFVVLVFVVTLVKLGANVAERTF